MSVVADAKPRSRKIFAAALIKTADFLSILISASFFAYYSRLSMFCVIEK